jgi:hypothetical protein
LVNLFFVIASESAAISGVFTLFTLFTLFFDGAKSHFDCKNWHQVIASESAAISIIKVQCLKSGLSLNNSTNVLFWEEGNPDYVNSLSAQFSGKP